MKKMACFFVVAALVLNGAYSEVSSQVPEFKITGSDGSANDSFGNAVAISGDYAILGAPFDDDKANNSGSAYIFQLNGGSWLQIVKLTASEDEVGAGDHFGYSVAISGAYAIVGAPDDDDRGVDSGSAYIFQRSGSIWQQVAKLNANDAGANESFGYSVAISGDYAIVGTLGTTDKGTQSGSAYIFQRSGSSWVEVIKLGASDGAAYDYFGYSVSIAGDYAIVGVPFDDDKGSNSGSAYIFQRSGNSWLQIAKLTPGDGAAEDLFGSSVAISGDYVVVGAYSDDDEGSNSGSAYIFQRSGSLWLQMEKLTANDGGTNNWFGSSVAISGDYAVVGAKSDDDKGNYSGSVYIFQRDGSVWNQMVKLTSSDGAADDFFGSSVAISGNYVIVGAPGDDDKGTASGSTYLYQLTTSLNNSSKIGVFRPSIGWWFLDANGDGQWSGCSTDKCDNLGIAEDIPVTGDWSGDGTTKIGVFRPSIGWWFLDYNGNGQWDGCTTDRCYNFGISEDTPVTGDWNGDGKTEIGVFRKSIGWWFLDYNADGTWSGCSTDRCFNFGISEDTPVTGDWNGDGKTEIGVFRPGIGWWFVDVNGDGTWSGCGADGCYNFGISVDLPVTGDWNGDGYTEIGVYRPSIGMWFLDYNGNDTWNDCTTDRCYQFGISVDVPVSGVF